MKTVLVTGANGFIGKNLIVQLKNEGFEVMRFTRENTIVDLENYVKKVDFVFHLAGINRPKEVEEFEQGNVSLTEKLIGFLVDDGRKVPLLYTSSTQAALENNYGRSKRKAENAVRKYSEETGADGYIFRLPNVFGKWCRPYYNSAIATFCHNIAHEMPINVNDPSAVMNLVYIDDVVTEFINVLNGKVNRVDEFCHIPIVHTKILGEIVDLIYSFKNSRLNRSVPNLVDMFEKKLYSTYLTYLPEDQFSYKLKMNVDNRGSFTEVIKTVDRGQVSVNISKPGITKGNHWHHTKNEKFLVVSGSGVIRFRQIDSDKVIEYFVSEEKLEVVDIPPGYTHNIENLGDKDMVTIMWANELFDPEKPDTYFLEV